MPRNARLGDPIDHGGNIITASPDTFTNGIAQARVTDKVRCKKHGIVEIVTGSANRYVNGLRAARLGDSCSCGAKIIDPVSPDTYTGDTTSSADSDLPIPPPVTVRVDNKNITISGQDVFLIRNNDDQLSHPTPSFLPTSNPAPMDKATTTPPPQPTPPCKCDEIPDNPPETFPVGGGYTVADVSSKAPASPTVIPANFNGLTRKDIVCNLRAVVSNCVEPIKAQFSGMLISSGFRTGSSLSSNSQHMTGNAIDLQFPTQSTDYFWNVANWARENIEYDQMLVEYHAHYPVLHVSFKCSGNRKTIGTIAPNSQFQTGFNRYR